MNDTEPTMTVNTVAARDPLDSVSPAVRYSMIETSCSATTDTAEQRTSCGIAVILTRRAIGNAITKPMRIAAKISGRFFIPGCAKNSTMTATVAPNAPSRFPLRAVFGPDRPLSASTKQIATRGRRAGPRWGVGDGFRGSE